MRTALLGLCGLAMLLALPAVSMSEEGRWAVTCDLPPFLSSPIS